MIEAEVVGDPVEPGVERAVATERRQRPVGLQEALLRQIVRQLAVVDEPVDVVDDAVLIPLENLGKGCRIAC